jgi:hypothetical protein
VTALVVHPGTLARRPYPRWLHDYPHGLAMIGAAASLRGAGELVPGPADGYRFAAVLEDYFDDELFFRRAREIARRFPLRAVIAPYEPDLIRAGALRDELGLPGQGAASALAFRDKVAMKDAARAAGIPVAGYAAVTGPAGLLAFGAAHPGPVILKPRAGAGAAGVRLLRTAAELREAAGDPATWAGLGSSGPGGREVPGGIAEEFVEGPMYHVDGLVTGGRIAAAWPSAYLYRLMDFPGDAGPRVDVALEAGDPLGARLLDFAAAVLRALPTPPVTTFHAEIFRTPADRLVLCEVASRTPGLLVPDVLRVVLGADLRVAWPRAALGLPVPPLDEPGPRRPRELAGQVTFLKRRGLVTACPGPPPYPWVTKFVTRLSPGVMLADAARSGDYHTAVAVRGPDQATVLRRLRTVTGWVTDRTTIDTQISDVVR